MATIAPDPSDPLYRRVPLPHRATIPVLGVPVRFAASHAALIAAVEETYRHWRGLAPGAIDHAVSADVRLYLHDGDEGGQPPRIVFRAMDPYRWFAHTRGSLAVVDAQNSRGLAWATRALLNDAAFYRRAIVGFLTMHLVTTHDRTPMHAAMVGDGDTGLLLAGPTGSGKSTLAYAAARAGLRFLSDDAVYVQRAPWRIWREAAVSLLLPDAARRFPELKRIKPARLPRNKVKLVIPMQAAAGATPWVTRAGVCLVRRTRRATPRVERVSAAEVRRVLLMDHVEDRERFGARLDEVADRLSADGGWRLSVGDDPTAAVPLLRELLRIVARGA